MKVLLVNGSPHKEGCTYTALSEVSKALNESDIDTDMMWIGVKPISGCIACKVCVKRENVLWAEQSMNSFLSQEIMMALYSVRRFIGVLLQVV